MEQEQAIWHVVTADGAFKHETKLAGQGATLWDPHTGKRRAQRRAYVPNLNTSNEVGKLRRGRGDALCRMVGCVSSIDCRTPFWRVLTRHRNAAVLL